LILALPARAKLNLGLEVLARLADGNHQIRTLIHSISLHDLVEMSPAGETDLLEEGFPTPGGTDNLVLQAAAALEKAAGRRLPARIRLLKRIPPGSGLGGGSSDAAATLRGLARLHRLETDLRPIAAGLGADVPFFLLGGCAVASGKGELLERCQVAPAWFALAWPGWPLSTADVYAAWDRVGGEGVNQLARAASNVAPEMVDFIDRLGPGWVMTGSGSAYFKSFADREAAAAAIAGLDCWTAVAREVEGLA
jgi:4-diphosphocytidyl-2-C-methyl-D-erythritol kinase